MVPGEYSPWKPTTSGRAWAPLAAKSPAPMVAANAIAILDNMNLSAFNSPALSGRVNSMQTYNTGFRRKLRTHF
jgi:hypothetical protein